MTRGRASRTTVFACVTVPLCVLLSCAGLGSASGQGAAAGAACADVSAAVMGQKTGGTVPNCAAAKAVHLCERDPQSDELGSLDVVW